MSHCQQTLIHRCTVMTAPVPWSLAWSEDGELAPQDRFDLLQTLVCSENLDVQGSLVAAVESISLLEVSSIALGDVTGLCA
jgi:hypothetical protein